MSARAPDGAADPAATPPQSVRLLNLPNSLTLLRLAVVPLFALLLLSDGGMDDGRRIWATLFFAGAAWGQAPQEGRKGTGLPVPRYVSLKTDRVNLREQFTPNV